MKIARLLNKGKETYGLIKDGKVATKETIIQNTGIPIPPGMKEFLFDGWFDEIKKNESDIPYVDSWDGTFQKKSLAPIPVPPKIICLAFNYYDHAREQGLEPPNDPSIVIKPSTALNGTNSEIKCPNFVTQLDYEIELAMIIGKTCKNVKESEAKDVIFGYMILNDVSARDIQFKDKQFTRAKGMDTFAPCGPWITTADEIQEPNDLTLLTRVNGEIRQNSNSKNMCIKVPQIISKLSSVMTLQQGDIISTGTPAGVALKSSRFDYLKDGDKIDMEIQGLGSIHNVIKFVKC
jgi:2-keto-4-pentenoate hydratase/2-oxohepta-3-ene-1,7-dioic acid hydratase in catechol pathway